MNTSGRSAEHSTAGTTADTVVKQNGASLPLDEPRRRLIRSSAGLEPYSGPWNEQTAAHLLRRTVYGPTRNEVVSAAALSLDETLSSLLSPQPTPPIPTDPTTPGRDWVSLPFSELAQVNYLYDRATKEWWMGLLARQGVSITEQMTLFWHNSLASQSEVVRDARYMFTQNTLFRRYALGNVKDLITEVTIDPAMLVYLNGTLNRVPVPDENYARELLELFTIGKGPQVGVGNYTHYTEDDVQAAARVLTGWGVKGYNEPFVVEFIENRHDLDPKQFSPAFQNAVLQVTRKPDDSVDGFKELQDLIDLIFQQPETARSFCRKLYRWFVYYDIDETVEQNVIVPLANIMTAGNFELRPVLDTLLRSAHFFDAVNVGCMIKHPVSLAAGTARLLALQLPDPSSPEFAATMRFLVDKASRLQMELLDPPNVAGWAAYYQIPDFYQLWVNTTTLGRRGDLTDAFINGFRPSGFTEPTSVDVVRYAETMPNPGDPFELVRDITADLLPPLQGSSAITPGQTEYLLYNVMGLVKNDEYEWTLIWDNAHMDPPLEEAENQVRNRLKKLLKFVLRMAEYQLT